MAMSNLSSLGLGSDGALSYDVIDKLRAVDERAQLDPITKKLEANSTRQKDLSALVTMTANLKSATSTLSDEMSYLKRTVLVSDSAINVTASSGVAIQDFTLHIDQIAQRDIYQTKAYEALDTSLNLDATSLYLNIGTKEYTIPTTPSTTLTDLKDAINEVPGENITASILNVGGDSPYRLILKSNETGEKNSISFSSNTLTSSLGLDIQDNHLQKASDAHIIYNGVSIVRANNTIDDLIIGLQITLQNKHDAEQSSHIVINQDTSDIKQSLTSLVNAYNELIANLNESTKYDKDSETAGTFQGVSQINSLSASIRGQLLSVDNAGHSIADYGISLNENGYLSFDTSLLNEKMAQNSEDVATFFQGKVSDSGIKTEGFFSHFNTLLSEYIDHNKGILTLYQNTLVSEKNLFTKEKELTIERLDQRYETMAARFASYDSLINKLNNQFNALSLMIEASYKNTN